MSDTWTERSSDLKYGHGSALWEYWTRGEGFAKWSGAVHKWTTLRDLLLKAGVPAISADGLTTNIIMAVMPGYMKQAHAAAGKHAGRAAMTTDTKAKPYGDVKYADPKNGKYPIDSEAHCRAAWSYINMPKNAAMYPMNGVTLSEVKDRIKAALKKYGADVSSDSSSASRALVEIRRDCQLEDIHIVRAAEGDSTGRVVEAYATVFDQPASIRDEQGHYTEVIDRSAFNDILAHIRRGRGGLAASVKVLYNHGKTMEGVPAPEFQKPLGKPLFVEPESRGLLTRTEYSKTPLGEEVLELIRGGSITAQSFVGACITSDPELRGPGDRYRARNGALTTVRRMVMGLREYGPVLWAAYTGAEILGVRMALPGASEDFDLDPDEEYASANEEDVTGSVPEDTTSPRYHQHALYRMTSEERRAAVGLTF